MVRLLNESKSEEEVRRELMRELENGLENNVIAMRKEEEVE